MTATVWIWSQVQTGLILLGLLSLLPPLLSSRAWAALIVALSLLGALPFLGLSPWLYAMTGQLSLGGLFLLLSAVLSRLFDFDIVAKSETRLLSGTLLMLGMGLYPMALGLGAFDPYAPGFVGGNLKWLVGLAAIAAWLTRLRAFALLLLAGLWSWYLGWGESDNLWDYLIDAWTFLALLFSALFHLILLMGRTLWRRR